MVLLNASVLLANRPMYSASAARFTHESSRSIGIVIFEGAL
jgi:hypothetical protein